MKTPPLPWAVPSNAWPPLDEEVLRNIQSNSPLEAISSNPITCHLRKKKKESEMKIFLTSLPISSSQVSGIGEETGIHSSQWLFFKVKQIRYAQMEEEDSFTPPQPSSLFRPLLWSVLWLQLEYLWFYRCYTTGLCSLIQQYISHTSEVIYPPRAWANHLLQQITYCRLAWS